MRIDEIDRGVDNNHPALSTLLGFAPGYFASPEEDDPPGFEDWRDLGGEG